MKNATCAEPGAQYDQALQDSKNRYSTHCWSYAILFNRRSKLTSISDAFYRAALPGLLELGYVTKDPTDIVPCWTYYQEALMDLE